LVQAQSLQPFAMLPSALVPRLIGDRPLEYSLPSRCPEWGHSVCSSRPCRTQAAALRSSCAAGLFWAAVARQSRPRRRTLGAQHQLGAERHRRGSAVALSAGPGSAQIEVRPEIRRVDSAHRSHFLSQCPPEDAHLPEIAVFGRSNVGKSSLINFLTGRKLLSTISKRPGHTKLIHHFMVDKSWYLVDLPGIGFAEGKGRQLKSMNRIVAAYVRHRTTLVELLYLVDASIRPTEIDTYGIKWLTDAGVYLSIVFTKTDKEPRTKELLRHGPAKVFSDALMDMEGSPFRLGLRPLPEMFLTSSVQKTGKQQLLEHIADLRRRARPRYLQLKRMQNAKGQQDAKPRALKESKPPPDIR